MKEVKTKPSLRDIKVLDKVVDVSHIARSAIIRSKEQSGLLEYNEDGNYVDDAANSTLDGIKTIIRKVGKIAKKYGKKAGERIKERRSLDKDSPLPDTSNSDNTRQTRNSEAKETMHQNATYSEKRQTGEYRVTTRKTVQAKAGQKSRCINKSTVQHPISRQTGKVIRQTSDSSGTIGSATRHSVDSGGKTKKKTAKGTVKISQKFVKTTQHTVKTTIKTSQVAAKTAVKTVQTAQRAAQSVEAAVMTAADSAKTALKAMATAIKIAAVMVKSLATLIAAGGWVAVVIILVICLAGLLLGSAYGVFYSSENPGGDTQVMKEVVSQLNNEFAVKLDQIKNENPHDTLEVTGSEYGTINNWRDILAVYAVKVADDPGNDMEVATFDDAKVGILRCILWDMNKIDYWTQTVEHEEIITTTDKDGNKIEKTATTTETILHINVISKSSTDTIDVYGFNAEQVKMLNELMQDEYRQLFMQLIGG